VPGLVGADMAVVTARAKLPDDLAFEEYHRIIDDLRVAVSFAEFLESSGEARWDESKLPATTLVRAQYGSDFLCIIAVGGAGLTGLKLVAGIVKTVAEAVRASAEARRADAEARRADAEARRADAEARRADAEARRADAEAGLLIEQMLGAKEERLARMRQEVPDVDNAVDEAFSEASALFNERNAQLNSLTFRQFERVVGVLARLGRYQVSLVIEKQGDEPGDRGQAGWRPAEP